MPDLPDRDQFDAIMDLGQLHDIFNSGTSKFLKSLASEAMLTAKLSLLWIGLC